MVAIVDRKLKRLAKPELFADTLVDQHVRIDRNTDREHETGHTGKRERRTERCKHRHRKEQVHEHREIGNDAACDVIHRHEDNDDDEAPDDRPGALRDRVRTKRRTDDGFLNDLYRRRKRTGLEYDLEEIRFGQVANAADLGITVRNFSLHNRRGIDNAIEHDRDLFFQIRLRDAAPHARTIVVHLHGYFRTEIGLADVCASIGDDLSGQLRLRRQEEELVDVGLVLPRIWPDRKSTRLNSS